LAIMGVPEADGVGLAMLELESGLSQILQFLQLVVRAPYRT
jgi:hypothetical protein